MVEHGCPFELVWLDVDPTLDIVMLGSPSDLLGESLADVMLAPALSFLRTSLLWMRATLSEHWRAEGRG